MAPTARVPRSSLLALVLGSIGVAAGCGGSSGGHGGFASIGSLGSTAGTSSAVPTGTGATPSGTTTAGATPGVIPAAPQGMWLKGDFHVHSKHSGDADTLGDDIATVIKCAEAVSMDFTVISDHRQATCLTDPQFTGAQTPLVLIPGEEWGGPGHAGAHGLTRDPIYHSQDESQGPAVAIQRLQQTVDDIHSMGGIFLLNHPMDDKSPWLWPIDRFDGMEAWNQPWAFRSTGTMTPTHIQKWMTDHGFTAAGLSPHAEAFAATAATGGGQNWQRLKLYEAYLQSGRKIAAVAGGDSHYLVPPGSPTTMVFAAKRDKQSVLDGVKRRRTMIARSSVDAPSLDFTCDQDQDGLYETYVGDVAPLGRPLKFRMIVKNATDGKLDLIRNGQLLQRFMITGPKFEVTFTDTPTTKSWYRVDCWEKVDLSFPHASLLKSAVLGSANIPWLNTLLSTPGLLPGKLSGYGANLKKILDEGGPGALWLLFYGPSAGVTPLPVATRYPRLAMPKGVSQCLNVAVHDPDYCPGVLTSAIWAE